MDLIRRLFGRLKGRSRAATDEDINGDTNADMNVDTNGQTNAHVFDDQSKADPNGDVQDVDKQVKRREFALKKLMYDMCDLFSRFGHNYYDYPQLIDPIFEKRRQIVCGQYEPTDQDMPSCPRYPKIALMATHIVGIPDFWLKALTNSRHFGSKIQVNDRPILKYLVDIRETMSAKYTEFTVELHFSPNEYFPHDVLKKKLYVLSNIDEDCGHNCRCRAIRCVSTQIHWNEGKDVTKMETNGLDVCPEQRSFFESFFWSSSSPLDEKQELRVKQDFEEFKELNSNLIPWSVLYYTNEAQWLDSPDGQH